MWQLENETISKLSKKMPITKLQLAHYLIIKLTNYLINSFTSSKLSPP